jgi:methylphosphotriester-DNA--protein-cysteine methyltransferase
MKQILATEPSRLLLSHCPLGYTSEGAFGNAAKRTVGVSPKRCRSARMLDGNEDHIA